MFAAPLSPSRFGAFAVAWVLMSAGYCWAHGLVAGGTVDPALSLAWGVASTLPWWSVWELLKRGSRDGLSIVAAAAAALCACVLMQHAANVYFAPQGRAPLLEVLYLRLPLALALIAAAYLLLPRAARSSSPVPALALEPEPAPALERELGQNEPACALEVPTRHGTITVALAEIDYIKAAANYVELVAGARTHLYRATLSELEARFEAAGFVRIHRSLLVNRAAIAGTHRDPKGRLSVKLNSGASLPIGRTYADAVRPKSPPSVP